VLNVGVKTSVLPSGLKPEDSSRPDKAVVRRKSVSELQEIPKHLCDAYREYQKIKMRNWRSKKNEAMQKKGVKDSL
jgi:hypothetical protein